MQRRPAQRLLHRGIRSVFSLFPRSVRFAVYRSFVECDPAPDARLTLKIAESREELEACFALLHDAYVGSGFMRPHPSGMRVTIYHALPTTTTLCAKYDDEVVGTISLIRESVFGFPLQAIFDLHEIREKGGRIAEVSALAVHPRFRKTGGSILFPLMKFMYEYCVTYFDTRHLVIAVNPDRIEMYESLLLFERLTENQVDNYDFVNGAPAVGASLDLYTAPRHLEQVYRGKPARKDLYGYFLHTRLKNIAMPNRRYFTTNDPVMTPVLLDYFFNQRTETFESLTDRERGLLHSIYNIPEYLAVLPTVFSESDFRRRQRSHARYSLKCPGTFSVVSSGHASLHPILVVEFSDDGFLAYSKANLQVNQWGEACIQLGKEEVSAVMAVVVRAKLRSSVGPHGAYSSYGFKVLQPDLPWRKLVAALKEGLTHADLDNASEFLSD